MITNIVSNSPWVTVDNGTPSMPYMNTGALSVGQIRYNPNNRCMEVYDGNMWMMLSSAYTSINLSSHANQLLNWVSSFMAEHEKEKKLREESQAVKNAWEQYQVVKILAEKETAR